MEQLSLEQMEAIEGGGLGDFIDWVCGGVTAGNLTLEVAGKLLASRGASLAMGPVGWAVGAACTVYGIGKLVEWW